MAIRSFFFNALPNPDGTWDREYNANNMSDYLNLIVGSGVFPNPSTNLQVMAASGFNLVVQAGSGWIDGRKMENTTDMSITLDSSDVLLNRIDRVIFYLDYTAREMGIDVIKGELATNPVAPDLTRTADRMEYCLATVAVNKQVSAITQADITDTRADSTVCGWVAGLIQQVDTSTLFNQWQTAYAQFMETMEDWQDTAEIAFDEWFRDLTDKLNVDTYVKNYEKYVTLTASDSKIIPLNMQGYTYENSDVLFVYLNGLAAAPTVDYLLDTRQTPVELHVNLVGSSNVTDEVYIKVLKSVIGIPQLADNNGNAIATSNGNTVQTD